jgi:hypothetical protein
VFYDDLGIAGLPGSFAITIVYVWLFNRTGGSLLLTILFHVAQGSILFKDLGFTGADLSRMDGLNAVVYLLIAAGVLILDRSAWSAAPPSATYVVPDRPVSAAEPDRVVGVGGAVDSGV